MTVIPKTIRMLLRRGGARPTRRGLQVSALGACLIALSGVAGAGDARAASRKSTAEDQKSLSITVYNSNLGLVKDVRRIKLPRGIVNLNFEGVASQIDPTSVHIRSLDHSGNLSVLEQNFEYDLISPAKLMEKYLGHRVELVQRKDKKEATVSALLLGNSGGYVYEIDGKIAVNPQGRVVLPEIPEGLISRPTLIWLLENGRSEHTIEASYLTGGISWKSDYVLVLAENDKSIDLAGWVTIDNRSGAAYANASLKLVAGDVHRATPDRGRFPEASIAMDRAAAKASQFVERGFFEYHLYTLQRRSTIKNNQTKQINLLEAENTSVKKVFVYEPRVPYWFSAMSGPDKRSKVGVFLEFDNTKQNHLGMPLPKGTVRVYKRDSEGDLQFIGEDAIDHTPEDETVRVKMGEAFDIVAERVQTRFKVLRSGHLYESSYKVEVRNHKDRAVVVSVSEVVPGDWEILDASRDYVKDSSNRIHFDLPVARKGSAQLTYTVRIRY